VIRTKFYAVLALASVITGCAVGPDFQRPGPPDVASYTSTTLPEETATAPVAGGSPQRLAGGRDIPAEWWTLFHSTELDELIRSALADNPTLAAAQAALRQAQENLKAQTGTTYFPSIDAGASLSRNQISGAAFGQSGTTFAPFTLYNASVNVSYSLDLFGGARRELEALRSQVDLQQYLLTGADLALTANIATAAFRDAALRATIRATRDIVELQEKQLAVVEGRFRAGAVALTDVLAQRTQLAQTRALLPPLQKEASRNRHLLAVLAGRFPGEASSLPEFELEQFTLPAELPISLPSSLVRQRPDILAAESVLHRASAGVGIATANLYPRITLTGSYGSEAVRSGDLFSAGTAVWGLGAGLTQPLFHGGALRAKKREAVAAFDQAGAQYRETVLQAFQSVADVLRALELDAQALRSQADAAGAAQESLELARKQYQFGATSYLTLLNAERSYQEAQISLIQAQAARFADTAALFQALGGGWWNRSAIAETAVQTAATKKE
jgi:NodT family efflux transporter outer membrane factor (OMF) lipoprotein